MRGSCAFLLLCSLCFLEMPSHGAQISQHSHLLINPTEVNLLSQTLLQFGWGLKREANNTKEAINSIFQQLDTFNVSVTKLFAQVMQTATLGEDLDRKARQFLENDEMYHVVTELYEELARIHIHGALLGSKIKSLEEMMQKLVDERMEINSSLNTTNSLSLIESQNIRIDALMEVVDLHQDQINSQEVMIKRLMRKVGSRKIKNTKKNNDGATVKKSRASNGLQ